MNRLLKIIKKYDCRASAHVKVDCDLDIELRYEAWERCYEHIRIRDAVRYPGRIAEPSLRQWLDDNRKEYEDAKEKRYREIEERNMKRYTAGFVRPLFNMFEE